MLLRGRFNIASNNFARRAAPPIGAYRVVTGKARTPLSCTFANRSPPRRLDEQQPRGDVGLPSPLGKYIRRGLGRLRAAGDVELVGAEMHDGIHRMVGSLLDPELHQLHGKAVATDAASEIRACKHTSTHGIICARVAGWPPDLK